MAYAAGFSKKAEKELQKLDKYQAKLIYNWVANNIDGCKNPRAIGKALTANLQGYWRYEVGKYRLICDIQDDVCIVIVVK
ncbi:MAG: type II toxin-antitoxin system RelE/ParE family toxin [Lachnospiraceae bacterium]|nr:type II toxin-antitoxin system RelE/ParE family toxin [Lachnospiraceae bacterium]